MEVFNFMLLYIIHDLTFICKCFILEKNQKNLHINLTTQRLHL